MISRYGEIQCDSCSVFHDGDPFALVEINASIPEGIKDPAKARELTYFWLCRDCKEGYPNGATDFFIKEYFTEDSFYLCTHCNEFIPEDVRDAYDDTEVCLTCSPPIEESDNE
jgi:phage terminase large subunit GpA-like protein